jgi:uncharacterized protein YihD (DUF1040 family)
MTTSHVTLADGLFRDPLRIPHTLSALASYWKQKPDLTIGRIIDSVGLTFAQDPYYLEDEVFLDHFKMNVGKDKADKKEENPDMLPVLSALEAFWMQNQDFRLGQIVGNAATKNNEGVLADLGNDEFVGYLQQNEGVWA